MKLEKYSFGIGDRFAQQGEAQLKAILKAGEMGISIVPVWNKSNREQPYWFFRKEPERRMVHCKNSKKARFSSYLNHWLRLPHYILMAVMICCLKDH